MGSFDDFTNQLGADHEAKLAEHRAQKARERSELERVWDAEIAMIEADATPLIEEARRACQARGLRPAVNRTWEPHRFTNPSVEFQLFGPKERPHDASSYEIEANKALVRVEDGKLRASVSKRALNSTIGADYVGYGIDGVREALRLVIASYFDEIDPSRQ
ncbi:hypothetical protein M9978_09440 [Sphingomonas sp. MG17]|uniref:Uncharacterized protein n=1 Tax=Sphingomonas tagetis TaxID=2949092 RepID=A0A9X2HRN8_9SPHN|nr:hypothetical protein [Sphingomonas tagetis]MCP3730650.1 hypothetical protein [Sphingomonas tagetis]